MPIWMSHSNSRRVAANTETCMASNVRREYVHWLAQRTRLIKCYQTVPVAHIPTIVLSMYGCTSKSLLLAQSVIRNTVIGQPEQRQNIVEDSRQAEDYCQAPNLYCERKSSDIHHLFVSGNASNTRMPFQRASPSAAICQAGLATHGFRISWICVVTKQITSKPWAGK